MLKSAKFRRKPQEVEAIQITGQNDAAVMAFCPQARDPFDRRPNIILETASGDVLCNVGDWIIRRPSGEFARVGRDEFAAVYETVSGRDRHEHFRRYEGASVNGMNDGLRVGCME